MTTSNSTVEKLEKATQNTYDALIVGAGFAGMYMLYKLRNLGFTAKVIEAGDGVGGTWYWNRYPGARCDVWSMEYSYQFSEELQQEWVWSQKYAPQPEILKYANHVADRFDLRKDIIFNTKVLSAKYIEETKTWIIKTDDNQIFNSQFCIMATGCLSTPNKPKFKGIDDFKGPWYHTGQWPHEGVDFTGKRVGIIGTGSSAIQSIPVIAEQAKQLFVFQRTANYTIPAHNRDLDLDFINEIKSDYQGLRDRAKLNRGGTAALRLNEVNAIDVSEEDRIRQYQKRWEEGGVPFMGSFQDLLLNPDSNKTAADFVKSKIDEIVDDPKIAELLKPKNIIGCKRLCVDTNYYQTFNQSHVKLIDVSETKIDSITEKGIKVGKEEYEVDAIVFATGFDAMTGALKNIDIIGTNNQTLNNKWEDGPRMYLGLLAKGFPNLFTITGPGSPSVLSNMLPSIEQHVDWISECIQYLNDNEFTQIEPTMEAEEEWISHVNEVAGKSLRSTCDSWYVGANIAGKPRVFMPYIGGVPAYREKCEEIVSNGYEGFNLT